MGGVSTPELPLPQNRFRHPEDAREQLQRGLDLHEKVFGIRPQGVWPSEGSVSEEALAIAHSLGVKWMATDEGVLGRSLGISFARDGWGRLTGDNAEKLYNIHRFENAQTQMHMVFRDHTISDLVGFVYSGMSPRDAAEHLMRNIREAAQPILSKGKDAIISIILDGENAWEYYPQSGREFLRSFYAILNREQGVEAVTVSEAIARHKEPAKFSSLVPGSWINANFNVWIGAPEDNRAWDYLYHAREFYAQNSAHASEAQRKLAFEELLIAEGSDWNWWYGPEHHSANDREFDELYRKHLSNVYQALGVSPPDYLAQPIIGGISRLSFVPQTAYIHPHINGQNVRYFEWMGAAMYTADRRAGAMHGKTFLLDSVYAGIDESNVYGRLDFAGALPEEQFQLVINLESSTTEPQLPGCALRLEVEVENKKITSWEVTAPDNDKPLASSQTPNRNVALALSKNFEFKLPLAWLRAAIFTGNNPVSPKVRLRFSLWENRVPVDALPLEGWIELHLLSEDDLLSLAN
jgi:hypothetical protein